MFAPLVVLSLIVGCVAGLLIINDSMQVSITSPLIVGGILTYAAATALLAHIGLSHIRRLERWSLTDSLSKLPNRRALHAFVQNHKATQEELAVAIIDLDGFKSVNDHYGHAVGDEVIKRCAEILLDHCGREAHAFRLGGDEFAICMIGPLAGTLVEGISRAFIDQFRKPIEVQDRRIMIGASIGITSSKGPDRISSGEAMRRSDVAMYASKACGKMRCTWYKSELDRNREQMRDLDAEMRAALANDEFNVAYQPLVSAKTGDIVAVECLLRWDARPDGPVGPHIFVPVAEESGLINAIGIWVLRRACEEALGWGDLKLSVNISAVQLRDVEFPILLGQILEETGFPAERLELEVTETCLVNDPVQAERSLDVIRGFGVNVSLDDFGTGYASIGFLRQFRFEKLKLDRSLVTDAQADEGSRAMMLSSISMARALKMDVTAEGVETEEQATLVRSAGCDQIQGWLYYKALPPEEIQRHFDLQIGAQRKLAAIN
ncbi:hypothetical protein AAW01_07825 [Aurantiacibacter gangjinensis]|uniref:Uncharacterized protein n=1 Tax=Aurantiacibacter gangjinensis TaxID=502682 RepID=A0A0G9MNA5_9SPHN|nr:hypothetical protein AAW01_07825 [Aurantiacibacter gangjinensis]